MDKEVHGVWWVEHAEQIPVDDDEQVLWLYDQWQLVDDWIAAQKSQPEPAAGQ